MSRAVCVAAALLMLANCSKPPVLTKPIGEKNCVAPVEHMRTSHMKLLAEWRDRAVRRNDRDPVARSLTGTCLRCHVKAEFCDRCHAYTGAKPDCWSCHNGAPR